MINKIARIICMCCICSVLVSGFGVATAKAKMISTETSIAVAQHAESRNKVNAFIEREDVQKIMVGHGVDVEEAKMRVASLTDAEVAEIAAKLDTMPAGSGAVGVIVGAALLVFFVLLITDLLDLTDVFPFTK
ncbi:PA2779 family protein [Oleidesulfovibrio sp.]|uniref:PA2779 family protein n=1 Tax=Oleidesulfovibrio sp. TaxID=2909707 RepID=UPI003A88FC46